jgi:hypothetical protein
MVEDGYVDEVEDGLLNEYFSGLLGEIERLEGEHIKSSEPFKPKVVKGTTTIQKAECPARFEVDEDETRISVLSQHSVLKLPTRTTFTLKKTSSPEPSDINIRESLNQGDLVFIDERVPKTIAVRAFSEAASNFKAGE